MQIRNILSAALLLAAPGVLSAPAPLGDALDSRATGPCNSPLERKEWRDLTKAQRLAYINAVKCLQSKPAKTGSTYPGAKSRYDDFQALHIAMTERIHFVGQFLPYHRQLLALYETELRNTCGYNGAQPYWDWTKDVKNFTASPVFDPVYGFGGNGEWLEDITGLPVTSLAPGPLARTGGGCVTNGPFASRQIPMGPGKSTDYTPHCLRRDFVPTLTASKLSTPEVQYERSASTYAEYSQRVELVSLNPDLSGMTTHGAGHFGVGGMVGEMSDMYSSPGDPLFWLHHAQLDNLWNTWQMQNWPARKSDIGGPDTMWGGPFNVINPYVGTIPYKNITLDFALEYPLMAPTVKIRDVMDVSAPNLCYKYA
ncbi:uncharacterized protein B0I36DRAFT_122126 [Microdochium trichocladiopsis]|uniref:Tyrosinase copper-binding domain-containing protein n=1 Tax=Microdochium trichocladiopsis TaxID=1682393 RepID=A0A9P9BQX9_9PEZI|nr:uncharacterized protein B0I36DRAFT_122126 [Microdochium trichocladiopsis]KAH7031367.1 hypothetical protein B0I36DRAFT_122126 [Microdochium trichocladiopsis]